MAKTWMPRCGWLSGPQGRSRKPGGPRKAGHHQRRKHGLLHTVMVGGPSSTPFTWTHCAVPYSICAFRLSFLTCCRISTQAPVAFSARNVPTVHPGTLLALVWRRAVPYLVLAAKTCVECFWHTVSLGLAQGCPLSPVLASALGHVWSAWVTRAQPCWVRLFCGRPHFVAAPWLRSDQYDRAFGFALFFDKCFVAARHIDQATMALAQELHFKVAESLEVMRSLGFRPTLTSLRARRPFAQKAV